MPGDNKQKLAFQFLQEQFRSQRPFTKETMRVATTWSRKSFETYWTKQFKYFVIPRSADNIERPRHDQLFRVTDAFRAYATWEKFRQHVSQVRRFSYDYKPVCYEDVLIYEFYMPLSNESALRMALDALFYKDTIKTRLGALPEHEVDRMFRANQNENKEQQFERMCSWIAKRFVGYSISQVNGRFRANDLLTMADAVKTQERGGRYLIDETTAVVRFIFPCDGDEEAIRWFFQVLFIDSIIQVVNGEAEIWMVESGMQNRLHIWRVES